LVGHYPILVVDGRSRGNLVGGTLAGVLPPFFASRLRAGGIRTLAVLFFIASVANLKAASTLALDNDLAVLRAQLDLSQMTPCGVSLLGDQCRALQADCEPWRANRQA